MNFDLNTYLESQILKVNRRLEAIFKERESPAPRLDAAMRYSLFAGGKRLRPVLCLAAAQAVSGNRSDEEMSAFCLDCACALEMIHTYSLIHDDLPAMDDDDFRRGKPTCHTAFDEATAILAGDALLTLAFEILADVGGKAENPRIFLDIILRMARASGSTGMVAGQMLDMEAEGKPIVFEALSSLHSLKTGALITASLFVGGRLGGADRKEEAALIFCGETIGLAFQIKDDILDITGDSDLMGKATGSDLQRKKPTYPVVLGMEKAEETARGLVKKALESLGVFGESADALRALVSYMVNRQK